MSAKRPRDWKRIWRWTFWITTVAGVIIAIPLLSAIWPLLKVYWNTRSEAAVEANETFLTNQSLTLPQASAAPLPTSKAATSEAGEELATLESQLDRIADLDRTEIDAIVADHFGPAPEATGNPSTFDEDSAVFDDINKIIHEIEGERYHIYILELRDRNGNRSTRLAAYKKANADYERSMQTMKLVQSNSQLKSIYDAFSHVLAGMASEQTPPVSGEDDEEIELEVVPVDENGNPILEEVKGPSPSR